MNRLALSFHDQTLEVLYPASLGEDVNILFAAAASDVASTRHIVAIAEVELGLYTLRTDNDPAMVGLDRRDLLDFLQDEVVRALIVDAASAVMLHAGAVAWSGRTILLPGPTGSGKSSLAAWLVANGFSYATDEVVALVDNGTGLVGLPRAMVLKGEAAGAVAALPGFPQAAAVQSGASSMVQVALDRCASRSPQPCGLIVFPKFEAGAELRIASISAAQAGLRLVECNLNARNLPGEGFGEIVSLARSVPAISLRYGDFDQLGGVFDVLCRLLLDDERRPLDGRRFLSAFAEPVVPQRSARPAAVAAASVFEIPAATSPRPPRKLTIGMATYDDYDGVYFSLQALRLFHPEVTEDTSFLVIDNRPDGPCAAPLKKLETQMPNYRYVPAASRSGTAIRDMVFEEADSEFVLCMDCHVFVVPGALKRLLEHFDANPGTSDLLQGPLLFDDLNNIASHFHPEWRAGMYGYWEHDARADDVEGAAFDIPMHGLGLFACRRAAWPGFNRQFRGFGGEEGYIHEKFRQAGGRTLCLPFLRWVHRFDRPLGTPYPNRWADRIRNYLIGFREVGWSTDGLVDHFRTHLGRDEADRLIEGIELELAGS